MGLVVGLLVLLMVLIVGMWLTFGLIHLALYLFMAGLVGWLADRIVPGELPWGWLGAVVAGIVGGWIGTLIIGQRGPSLFGVHIIPALLGAIILAFIVNTISKGTTSRARR